NLDVVWSIPAAVPIGNYEVRWELSFQYYFSVPGGFNIDCIPPPAQIANPSTYYICSTGGNVSLQANTGTGYTYQWFKNNVLISGAVSSGYIATTAGTYHVRVTNAQGCPGYSAPVYIYQINPPSATVTSPSINTSICPGSNILLSSNTGFNFTYQWFKNGNLINGATSSTYSTSDTGSYTVRVTNSYGCTAMSTPRIISASPVPASYVTALGPLTFCNGSSVTLKTSAGTGYSYQWFKYGNPIAGSNSQTLVVTTAGSYKVQVTNSYGCTKKSGAKTTTVLPAPSATITPVGSTGICAGDSVRLNANTGSGYTYYWKKYGNVISGANSSFYYAKNAGPYKVVVTNSNGCSKVSAPQTVSIITCRKALVAESTEADIYPNPANDYLNIEGDHISKVEIRSLDGKIVNVSYANNTESINIESLAPGLYVAVIFTDDGIVTKRFLKADY
ncbi:MAG TPA: T9SS type A sorting domain-containing protein, partial [Bacteroidia bacterium]|nr:T9SS type A sorting domain-containing protein [Bacteroidia bacterium]